MNNHIFILLCHLFRNCKCRSLQQGYPNNGPSCITNDRPFFSFFFRYFCFDKNSFYLFVPFIPCIDMRSPFSLERIRSGYDISLYLATNTVSFMLLGISSLTSVTNSSPFNSVMVRVLINLVKRRNNFLFKSKATLLVCTNNFQITWKIK